MPSSVSSKSSKLSKDEKLVLKYFQSKTTREKPPSKPPSRAPSVRESPRVDEAQQQVPQEETTANGADKPVDEVEKLIDEIDFSIPVAALSEQKMRDYGYGVPQWSPYRMTKVTQTEAWQKNQWSTRNAEWGQFTKEKNSLDPKMQTRLARSLVKEMKDNACMDHTWEIIGCRPGQGKNGKPKFFMP